MTTRQGSVGLHSVGWSHSFRGSSLPTAKRPESGRPGRDCIWRAFGEHSKPTRQPCILGYLATCKTCRDARSFAWTRPQGKPLREASESFKLPGAHQQCSRINVVAKHGLPYESYNSSPEGRRTRMPHHGLAAVTPLQLCNGRSQKDKCTMRLDKDEPR